MLNEWILPVLWAALGALGFGFIFAMRSRKLLYTAIGGGLTWLIYLLGIKWGWNEFVACAVGAAIGTLYSEIIARALHTPVTVFVIPVNIPLVPGAALYYTFLYFTQDKMDLFVSKGKYTIGVAGAMALGIFVATMLFKIFREGLKLIKSKK